MQTTKEKIQKAAKENPCAAKTLKALFPTAFEDKKVFNFGKKCTFTESSIADTPLFIGNGLAPTGLEGKCLIINLDYTMQQQENMGYTALIFTKKGGR